MPVSGTVKIKSRKTKKNKPRERDQRATEGHSEPEETYWDRKPNQDVSPIPETRTGNQNQKPKPEPEPEGD